MKFRLDKQYRTAAFYAFGVILFTALWILALANLQSIRSGLGFVIEVLKPLIYGFCLAYLLYPAEYGLEKLFGKLLGDRHTLRRSLSVLLTYLGLLLVLTLTFALLLPQIRDSYLDLQNKITGYLSDSAAWIDTFFHQRLGIHFTVPIAPTVYPLPESDTLPNLLYHTVEQAENNPALQAIQHTLGGEREIGFSAFLQRMLNGLYDHLRELAPRLLTLAKDAVTEAKNLMLGVIISIYLLLSRERCINAFRILMTAFLPKKTSGKLFRLFGRLNTAFFHFVDNKISDAAMVFLLCLAVFSLFAIPYAPLVSLIMAISNLVPFVGPFVGAIPACFVVFICSPSKAVWFVLLLILVQAVDLYLIEAKLLGERSSLSPAWVLLAVSVMGHLFGIVGFLLAVPLTSVLYDQIRRWTNARLKEKNLPHDTADYCSM